MLPDKSWTVMALTRTYGKLDFDELENKWKLFDAEPHICIKLKAVFSKIKKTAQQPFYFFDTPENCYDLLWFTERYPLAISKQNRDKLSRQRKKHISRINELESILLPDYNPTDIKLKDGLQARNYQLKGCELYLKSKRLLIGDELGLGKTLIAILSFLHEGTLPALAVVQTHLPKQWQDEIERFTNLKVHHIKGTQPYSLPQADVYIINYSCVASWVNVFETNFFKSVVFDEVQELRRNTSMKYDAAFNLSKNVEYCLALSATPIYNYGDEIYNILDAIKEECLGHKEDFLREWTGWHSGRIVKEPQALGTYLRENFLFLKRSRAEVGRELPDVNTIIHTVGYDEQEVRNAEEIARQLAIKVTSGSFVERGMAARELDIFVRQNTGIAKAKEVAEYVKILLENNEPVLLAAWHREVYNVLLKELAAYNPVMYTGSESSVQKEKSKQAFINGETNLMIISLRSGAGLDGLQQRCKTVVIAELDWSPEVHKQLIGRADRDGQKYQVTVIYLVSECGSDPVIIDMLGLKASQSHGIVNPLHAPKQQYTNESWIKQLAEKYLHKHHSHNNNQELIEKVA